jgi:hypothetical protein
MRPPEIPGVSLVNSKSSVKRRVLREAALLTGLVFIGLVILPLSIYLVGQAVFGEYGNGGFASFYGELHRYLRDGEPVVWFLLLSPCLLWQLMRLTIVSSRQFRRKAPSGAGGEPEKL